MRYVIGVMVLCLFFALAGPASASADIVEALEVQGNVFIDDEDILNVVAVEVGDLLDPDALRGDLQAVFDLGWFYDVAIDFKPEGDGIRVIFQVRENFQLEGIRFFGLETKGEDDLISFLELELSKPLNTKRLEEGLPAIEELYHDEGYILARVDDVYFTSDGYLEITINEGYVGDVHIVGNDKTRDYVIEREIDLVEGEVFNVNRVQKNLQNIYYLGFFSENIRMDLQYADPQKNIADVYINLEEMDTGNFFFGGGYNTQTGWFGSISLEEKNLFGRGQEVGVNGELGMRSRSINLRFQEPHLFGSPYSIGTGFNWSFDREKDPDTEEYDFERRKIGGYITLGRTITDNFRISTRFRLDHTSLDHRVDPSLAESGQTRSITLTGVHNTTNLPMNPTSGGRESLSYEVAGYVLGGDYSFHKVSTDIRRYFPGFRDDQSWAFRLMGGIGGPGGLPSHEAFRVGGSETLRGYSFGEMRGDIMTLLNAEYRFNIYSIFDGVVFVDMGNAWEAADGVEIGDFGLSTGAGVRLNTPLGQFRFDVGVNKDLDVKPHFSIGQTF